MGLLLVKSSPKPISKDLVSGYLIIFKVIFFLTVSPLSIAQNNEYSESSAKVKSLRLSFKLSSDIDIEDAESIQEWANTTLKKQLNFNSSNQIKISRSLGLISGQQFFKAQQFLNGKPIEQFEATLYANPKTRFIKLSGRAQNVNLENSETTLKINVKKAKEIARASKIETESIVYWMNEKGQARLSHKLSGLFNFGDTLTPQIVFIDAQNGKELSRQTLVHSLANRHGADFMSACKEFGTPSRLSSRDFNNVATFALENFSRTENSARFKSSKANKIFDLIGRYRYYLKDVLELDSYDNKGTIFKFLTGIKYSIAGAGCVGSENNAQWRVNLDMAFIPYAMAATPEVIAHEFGHAIISSAGGLEYEGQSGALNESISDAIGLGFKIWLANGGYTNNKVDVLPNTHNDWNMNFPDGSILRNFQDPKSADSTYPSHFNEYRPRGGVHFNSSITNHGFYLLAAGGRHVNQPSNTVNGIGLRKAIKIYGIAAHALLSRYADFEEARYAFSDTAELLYGVGSPEVQSVNDAMDAIGIRGTYVNPIPTPKKSTPQKQEKKVSPKKEPQKKVVPQKESPKKPEPKQSPNTPTKKTKLSPKKKTETNTKTLNTYLFSSLFLLIGFLSVVTAILWGRRRPDQQPMGFVPQYSKDLKFKTSIGTQVKTILNIQSSLTRLMPSKSKRVLLTPLDGGAPISLKFQKKKKESFVLGRAPELVDIVLSEITISKRHCRISLINSELCVEDLNSSSGINLNNQTLAPFNIIRLEPLDLLSIASLHFSITY